METKNKKLQKEFSHFCGFEDRRNGRGLWIRYLMFERILEWLKGLAV